MLSSDFFRGTDGFFRRSARLFTKKVLFRPKSHQRLFRRYRWILGRFLRERWIFPRENLAVLVDSCSFFSEEAMEIPSTKRLLEDGDRLAPSFVRQLLLPLVLSGRVEGFLGRGDHLRLGLQHELSIAAGLPRSPARRPGTAAYRQLRTMLFL